MVRPCRLHFIEGCLLVCTGITYVHLYRHHISTHLYRHHILTVLLSGSRQPMATHKHLTTVPGSTKQTSSVTLVHRTNRVCTSKHPRPLTLLVQQLPDLHRCNLTVGHQGCMRPLQPKTQYTLHVKPLKGAQPCNQVLSQLNIMYTSCFMDAASLCTRSCGKSTASA